MIGRRLAPSIGLVVLACTAAVAAPHNDEIQAYAVITATAKTASDRCSDILINNDMIAKAPGFFH